MGLYRLGNDDVDLLDGQWTSGVREREASDEAIHDSFATRFLAGDALVIRSKDLVNTGPAQIAIN